MRLVNPKTQKSPRSNFLTMAMKFVDHLFSMSTISNASHRVRFSNEILTLMPPPGFFHKASPESKRRLNILSEFMTNAEGVAIFEDVIATLDRNEIHKVVSMLTFDSDYFIEIIKNQYGSRRVQKFLGKSDDVDAFFYAAIVRCFLRIMTDKYASYVVIRAIAVFNKEQKKAIYEHMIYYALDLACDQHGSIALNKVITHTEDLYYKTNLLNSIACIALSLTNNSSGNYVLQHVIKENNFLSTYNIAFNLRGHYVELSFEKYGSNIVDKLLETEESIVVEMVVKEFIECDEDKLLKLANDEYGNVVVARAMRATQEIFRVDMYWGLVEKLIPFIHILRDAHGNIANILMESII